MKRLIVYLFLVIIPVVSKAQVDDKGKLVKDAKKGNVEAMCQLGKSYLTSGDDTQYPEAYRWLTRASDMGNPQAKSLIAYMIKNKLVDIPMHDALHYAYEAKDKNDALGWWILAQMQSEPSAIKESVEKAFNLDYPLAKLLFAKFYATGNDEFMILKDEARSMELLHECADGGNLDAMALYGIELLRQGYSQAFKYLKNAADSGNPAAMAQLANMYYSGKFVDKDYSQAFSYFKMAADKGDLSGIEGLADCYRLGIGTGGVYNERASNLYASLEERTPRILFLRGYYLNKGEGVPKDTKQAMMFFEEAESQGNVFAQAYLGITCFEGADPFLVKDNSRSFQYLGAALANNDFDELPKSIASIVYQYASACKFYGFGTAEDEKEAEKLSDRSKELKSQSASEDVPFGLIGMMSPEESMESCSFSWESKEFSNILDQVTFDYPVATMVQPSQESEVKPRPAPSVKPTPEKPVAAPASKAPKSGKLVVLLEAAPYGFAPTSVVSSRDGNTYWLKGSALDVSASVGWQNNSGLFIGGGAGYEGFSGGRMSVIQGFMDARYFMGGISKGGFFLGARGGASYGSPEYGIGINASGMLGYCFPVGGSTALNFGLKAEINSFSDDAKTMGNVVGPFVGICF